MEDKRKVWGYHTIFNLFSCDEKIIRDAATLKQFVLDLCDNVIRMKRFGECQIVHFGNGELEGNTFIQLIETSTVMGHCVDSDNSAYIDIFSCCEYDVPEVVRFVVDRFKPGYYDHKYFER